MTKEDPPREADDGTDDGADDYAAVADAFDRSTDPLAAHAATFSQIDADPFDVFLSRVLPRRNLAASTRRQYDRVVDQWRHHMRRAGRHPACPNTAHVQEFIDYCCTERGNQPDTVQTKLRRLDAVYQYWQTDPAFPHPQDYDPFDLVLSTTDLSRPPQKEPPRLSIPEIASVLRTVTHLRDRTIIMVQLKLGLRASEVCNLRIGDCHLTDPALARAYDALGTHPAVTDRPNAVVIPSRDERDGNKSRQPRVLPLDAELHSLLCRHLRTRPDSGSPWVFQSQNTHSQLTDAEVGRQWREAFRPEYAETADHRAVTSHFGRHRFTTHWRVHVDLNRDLVKYLRGDSIDGDEPYSSPADAIDEYVHTYYEDIVDVYRAKIYEFDL